MTIPYEILIRGNAEGTLSGCHAITIAGGLPRVITADDLADLAPEINAAALARVAELEAELATRPAQEFSATQEVTKLTLMRRLQAINKWSLFKTILGQMTEEVQDAWSLAQGISKDDPMFLANADAFKQAFELSDDQFTALLTP